ncbi:MAG: DUF551 domain-containing protein [Clostridia bacterium]
MKKLKQEREEQEQNNWVSVKDRLPKGKKCVLVLVSGSPFENMIFENATCIAFYDENFKEWEIDGYLEWENPTVTYWRPIPKLPKEL